MNTLDLALGFLIEMPPVGFKLWVLLYVQSVKDGGQWSWSSVKHRHSASHAPQSICAAFVCQSNIALNPKIAPAWLRARFLNHVYINVFIYRHIGRARRRNLDGSPAGTRDALQAFWVRWAQSRGSKNSQYSLSEWFYSELHQKITSGYSDKCENKRRVLALIHNLLLQEFKRFHLRFTVIPRPW